MMFIPPSLAHLGPIGVSLLLALWVPSCVVPADEVDIAIQERNIGGSLPVRAVSSTRPLVQFDVDPFSVAV
jgi:hypothetical protein